jgi:hypothetical protein
VDLQEDEFGYLAGGYRVIGAGRRHFLGFWKGSLLTVPPRLRKIRCDRSVGAPPPRERDTERAMSQENVERLYRAYDAFNRRDLDAYLRAHSSRSS